VGDMTLFEQLRETVAATLKVDPATITETSSHRNVRTWDSLGQVSLMVALEDTFGIRLEPEDFPKLTSVAAILAHLRAEGFE
jgi:citrate synthase